jgi:molecular chaperone DnaK
MKSAVDVSDEAVEAMLAESLEHAFEDVNERIWTETRLKSEEMLTAVDSALSLVGNEISGSERDRISGLAEELRAALDLHETPRLKQASEALDASTQGLAAMVLEKAMANAGHVSISGTGKD